MAPRTLTIAGTDVARIGLGTNRLSSTPQNHDFLREGVEAGLGLIDTAVSYSRGDSERTIGEALSPRPDDLVVATKGGYSGSGDPESLRSQIEQSLESLRTDTIDLYYLHRVDPQTPLEVSLGVIGEYREAGKIREVGISAVDVEQIEAARQVVPIAAVQNHYNVADRDYDEVVDYCEENGIVFVPYYPLKGGGPSALAEVAEAHGATEAQIALAWLLRRSPAMLPIPGTLSIEHLRENLGALEIELTDAEFEALG
jgi:aryl-alcohol dehydrogenase-like predicted oxidoreductase